MIEVSQIRWMLEMKVYVERESKKNRRELTLCAAMMLAAGLLGFVIAFSKYRLWGIPLGCILVGSAVIIFVIGLFMGKYAMKMLEMMIKNCCTDEERLMEFDREFVEDTKDVLSAGTKCYIFSKHYLMYFNKEIWKWRPNQLLRYSDASRIKVSSHSCFFYRENEKKPFACIKLPRKNIGLFDMLCIRMPHLYIE